MTITSCKCKVFLYIFLKATINKMPKIDVTNSLLKKSVLLLSQTLLVFYETLLKQNSSRTYVEIKNSIILYTLKH